MFFGPKHFSLNKNNKKIEMPKRPLPDCENGAQRSLNTGRCLSPPKSRRSPRKSSAGSALPKSYLRSGNPKSPRKESPNLRKPCEEGYVRDKSTKECRPRLKPGRKSPQKQQLPPLPKTKDIEKLEHIEHIYKLRYFEHQSELKCGQHSLNNAFLNLYSKTNFNVIFKSDENYPKGIKKGYKWKDTKSDMYIFDLYKFCLQRNKDVGVKMGMSAKDVAEILKCSKVGNYDVDLLIEAVKDCRASEKYWDATRLPFSGQKNHTEALSRALENLIQGRSATLIINIKGYHYTSVIYDKESKGLYEIDSLKKGGLMNLTPLNVMEMIRHLNVRSYLAAIEIKSGIPLN